MADVTAAVANHDVQTPFDSAKVRRQLDVMGVKAAEQLAGRCGGGKQAGGHSEVNVRSAIHRRSSSKKLLQCLIGTIVPKTDARTAVCVSFVRRRDAYVAEALSGGSNDSLVGMRHAGRETSAPRRT